MGRRRCWRPMNEGIAVVPYPKFHIEMAEVNLVTVRIEHSEYCWANEHLTLPVNRSEPVEVTLQRGTTLRVGLVTEDGDALLADCHILIHSDVVQGTQFHEQDEHEDHWHVSNPMPAAWKAIRGVYLPENAPPQFTPLTLWSADDADTHEMLLTVQPGVRFEGRLDASVPRPVTNGQAVVCVTDPTTSELGDEVSAYVWEDMVEIAEDGTFVFESLPSGCEAQIIAMCDGYLSSRPSDAEIQAISAGYGGGGAGPSFTLPQVFYLSGDTISPEIAMRATGSVEIEIVDQEGRSVTDAMVAFWPNQYWFGVGSNIVSSWHRTSDVLRAHGDYTFDRGAFTAETNESGVATISRLPGGSLPFMVGINERPVDTDEGEESRVTIVPGETVEKRVIVSIDE